MNAESTPSPPALVAVPGVTDRPTPNRTPAAALRSIGWSRAGVLRPSGVGLAFVAFGAGVLLYGMAIATSGHDYDLGLKLFWISQIAPFVVFACLLVMGRMGMRQRAVVVSLVGVLPAIAYRSRDLMQFTGFDELLHQRTLDDLVSGSGPFAANPLLSVSPYYPGLEGLTGLLSRLTGAPDQLSAMIVVVACRLLLVLVIFFATLSYTDSDFQASLVVLFYACCPQFFSFNSQFAYQTLALSLGVGAMFLLRRAQLQPPAARGALLVAAVIGIAATVVTHHVTSWLVLAFLWLWVFGTRGNDRRVVLWPALLAFGLLVAWSGAILPRLISYFRPVAIGAFQGLIASFGGSSQRTLFADTSGVKTPALEQGVLVVYALICTVTAVMAGLILLRDARRARNLAMAILGLLALAYPATLAGRFSPAAADIGDRASTFLFLPLALATAGVTERYIFNRPVRVRSSRLPPAAVVGIVVAIIVAYFGGIVLGSGADWSRLPGSYLVEADYRSSDVETRAAVDWAGDHLRPGSRIVADRYPSALITGETRLYPVFEPERGLEPASLYYSQTWSTALTQVVRGLAIKYIYVDTRLSQDLPRFGIYFYPGETTQLRRLTAAGLTKFGNVPGITPIYRHGPIAIYDTTGLGTPTQLSGWSGNRSPLPLPVDLGIGVLLGAGIYLGRRRLGWVGRFARAAGPIGTGAAVMSVLLFVGLALFWLRILPGPALPIATVITLGLVVLARERSWLAAIWRRRPALHLNVYVLLGCALAVVGLYVAWHRAYDVNVVDVHRVLAAAVTRKGNP
jgi:hypothetical protein